MGRDRQNVVGQFTDHFGVQLKINIRGRQMSNVIDFLERMGQNGQLRHASQNEVEFALSHAQLNPDLQAAILAKDQSQLQILLGQGLLYCMLSPSEEDDEDAEEGPSRDGDEISLRSVFRVAASAG
jgi:hypothetical protein